MLHSPDTWKKQQYNIHTYSKTLTNVICTQNIQIPKAPLSYLNVVKMYYIC